MTTYLLALNSVNREFNKTKKLNELALECGYKLKAIKSVKTKYGLSKVATLLDQDLCSLVDVFLPTRYNDIEFNMNYNHLLMYHGKKRLPNGNDFHDLEFVVCGELGKSNIVQQQLPAIHNSTIFKILH
jgi:hypothetical protein